MSASTRTRSQNAIFCTHNSFLTLPNDRAKCTWNEVMAQDYMISIYSMVACLEREMYVSMVVSSSPEPTSNV